MHFQRWEMKFCENSYLIFFRTYFVNIKYVNFFINTHPPSDN